MAKIDWKDVGKYIGTAAPLVGSLFGPAGTAIGGIVSTLLGTANKPDAIIDALKTDPQALVKLKQYEMAHTEALQKMQLQAYGMQLASATKMEDNITERHANDMRSDNTLSKNIRPLSLITGFLILVIVIVLDTYLAKTVGNIRIGGMSPEIVQQVFATVVIMLKFYFGGRTIEKITGGAIQKTVGAVMSKIKPATEEKY